MKTYIAFVKGDRTKAGREKEKKINLPEIPGTIKSIQESLSPNIKRKM